MNRLWTMLLLGVACAPAAEPGGWTEPVEVRSDETLCVSYRARLDGSFLVVQATHEAGWHTTAMDNQKRAMERLRGRQSLGIDHPTRITVSGGLAVAGPWHQSPPKDYSKPELLWFTWGFEGQAVFMAKVRPAGAGPARIAIRGQACTESTCKSVDVAITLPRAGFVADAAASSFDRKTLIPVR